jgi:hypothetical protein
MKSPITNVLAVASFVVVASLLIWMNRYHYEREHNAYHVIRMNNFTGQVCYSQSDGTWNSQINPSKDKNKDSKYGGHLNPQQPPTDSSKDKIIFDAFASPSSTPDDAKVLFGEIGLQKNMCE